MKKWALLFFLPLSPLLANQIKMTRSLPQESPIISIGYISLTQPITDFNDTVKALKKYADDVSIDCIILHINSPGGLPGNSQIIADFILWTKQFKPVIAFISDSGTSGAYWIAAACSYIIAPETAHIGSIGVACELPKKNNSIALTAGKFKRARYLAKGVIDPEYADLVQKRLDITYDLFCKNIAKLRGLSVETILNFEAQVFLGAQAQQLGLIDEIGTLEQVLHKAVELTMLKKNNMPSLIRLISSPTEIFEFAV